MKYCGFFRNQKAGFSARVLEDALHFILCAPGKIICHKEIRWTLIIKKLLQCQEYGYKTMNKYIVDRINLTVKFT